MKIPKIISPNNLKDTIVEIRYSSSMPTELIPGILSNVIEGFGFVSTSKNTGKIDQIILASSLIGVFANDDYTIQIKSGSVVFNSVGEYKGWSEYRRIINNFLEIMNELKIPDRITRIGVRYISQFKKLRILDNIKGDFDLYSLKSNLRNSNFRTEFSVDGYRVILNLANEIETQNEPEYSLFDVDVIKNIEEHEQTGLIDYIDKCHFKQKEIFFGLITDDFLNTLNPEY